jgi:hypothetical protein
VLRCPADEACKCGNDLIDVLGFDLPRGSDLCFFSVMRQLTRSGDSSRLSTLNVRLGAIVTQSSTMYVVKLVCEP